MVPVLDKHKKPLMPCTEKRARLLLQRGCAVVHRRVPFVIRLKDRTQEQSALQPVALKLDPGSRITGMAIVREEETEEGTVHHALHLAELEHRGQVVHQHMLRRAQARRRRRSASRAHDIPPRKLVPRSPAHSERDWGVRAVRRTDSSGAIQ